MCIRDRVFNVLFFTTTRTVLHYSLILMHQFSLHQNFTALAFQCTSRSLHRYLFHCTIFHFNNISLQHFNAPASTSSAPLPAISPQRYLIWPVLLHQYCTAPPCHFTGTSLRQCFTAPVLHCNSSVLWYFTSLYKYIHRNITAPPVLHSPVFLYFWIPTSGVWRVLLPRMSSFQCKFHHRRSTLSLSSMQY